MPHRVISSSDDDDNFGVISGGRWNNSSMRNKGQQRDTAQRRLCAKGSDEPAAGRNGTDNFRQMNHIRNSRFRIQNDDSDDSISYPHSYSSSPRDNFAGQQRREVDPSASEEEDPLRSSSSDANDYHYRPTQDRGREEVVGTQRGFVPHPPTLDDRHHTNTDRRVSGRFNPRRPAFDNNSITCSTESNTIFTVGGFASSDASEQRNDMITVGCSGVDFSSSGAPEHHKRSRGSDNDSLSPNHREGDVLYCATAPPDPTTSTVAPRVVPSSSRHPPDPTLSTAAYRVRTASDMPDDEEGHSSQRGTDSPSADLLLFGSPQMDMHYSALGSRMRGNRRPREIRSTHRGATHECVVQDFTADPGPQGEPSVLAPRAPVVIGRQEAIARDDGDEESRLRPMADTGGDDAKRGPADAPSMRPSSAQPPPWQLDAEEDECVPMLTIEADPAPLRHIHSTPSVTVLNNAAMMSCEPEEETQGLVAGSAKPCSSRPAHSTTSLSQVASISYVPDEEDEEGLVVGSGMVVSKHKVEPQWAQPSAPPPQGRSWRERREDDLDIQEATWD